jgi:hypothetical protein
MQVEEYLTKESKSKYRKDFEVLTSFKESEFWDLDEGVLSALTEINKLDCLHTLYSRRDASFNEFALERESYLQIAFTKEVEAQLLDVLNEVRASFQSDDCEIEILKEPPLDNPNVENGSHSPLGCRNDPDYFRLYSYTISITSDIEPNHDRFFSLLKNNLSILRCSS